MTRINKLTSLDVTNNDICTPNIPNCIISTQTITAFYDNQQCVIIPDEEDMDFIMDIITENWGDTASTDKITALNNLTTWETFTEGNTITSRITEIRYDDQGITNIPISLEDVDSLERIELQENQIESIPNIIGNLSRLKYITIQKNNITTIPARIGELEQLEVFKIYDNELVEVHENIGQLLKLISLNLSYNHLESLPESMCNILSNPEIQISIDNNNCVGLICPRSSSKTIDVTCGLIDNTIMSALFFTASMLLGVVLTPYSFTSSSLRELFGSAIVISVLLAFLADKIPLRIASHIAPPPINDMIIFPSKC